MSSRDLIADRGDAGRRLDLVLSRHLADVEVATRTRIQRWIADGLVAVNGASARRVSRRVAAGDTLTITLPARPPKVIMAAESAPLSVHFEDGTLLVVEKAAGMVCHPTHAHAAGTLMNALLWHARDWPAGQRPSLVGRLDKWTSGLVLVAKSAAGHAALQRTLASAASVKEYVALVYGAVAPGEGEIRLRLARDPGDRRRVVASASTGVASLTTYRREASVDLAPLSLSVVRCRIATGRTHQIRVHLAAVGWPIVGDPVYGEPRWPEVVDPEVAAVLAAFPRQALHAARVAFVHPQSGQEVDVSSPLPPDLAALLEVCGLATGGDESGRVGDG